MPARTLFSTKSSRSLRMALPCTVMPRPVRSCRISSPVPFVMSVVSRQILSADDDDDDDGDGDGGGDGDGYGGGDDDDDDVVTY